MFRILNWDNHDFHLCCTKKKDKALNWRGAYALLVKDKGFVHILVNFFTPPWLHMTLVSDFEGQKQDDVCVKIHFNVSF